jgi:N-acetylglucosaminyldiphosphoundecaprenol N-acetyl-beta-D-mannosaminyltransferase
MTSILGIKLSDLTKPELLIRLDSFLDGTTGHLLVTPNPEIILRAQKDEEYFYILNAADIAIADGFGLVLAGLIEGKKIPRITGSDLTPELLNRAAARGNRVMIINWRGGLSSASDIKQLCQKRWPGLVCEVMDTDKKNQLSPEETAQLQKFAPQLVFVTLGAPYQEKLAFKGLKDWPSVRLALAVGGSFDFLTGKIKRAPQMMRALGLEWLWRLKQQPRRIKRIWQATVVFSAKVIRSTFILPFFYRPNVAIILYRETANGPEIAIVARQDNHDHWQLPQGGTDGEPLAIAGARELKEELGTDKFRPRQVFAHVYRYRNDGKKNKRHVGYKGQSQGLFIAEFTGQDKDIRVNYWDHYAWQWIPADKLVATVHPYRQAGAVAFLKKFKEFRQAEKIN